MARTPSEERDYRSKQVAAVSYAAGRLRAQGEVERSGPDKRAGARLSELAGTLRELNFDSGRRISRACLINEGRLKSLLDQVEKVKDQLDADDDEVKKLLASHQAVKDDREWWNSTTRPDWWQDRD